jgi:hypothetical protein
MAAISLFRWFLIVSATKNLTSADAIDIGYRLITCRVRACDWQPACQ